MLPTIHLSITHGYADCDDCGGYDYGHFEARFDDGFHLRANHDGHLSSGSWDGNDSTVYLWCLAKLGYIVHVNGTPVYLPPFSEQHQDRGFNEYRHIELLTTKPKVLDVQHYPEPCADYPQCTNLGRAVISGLAGESIVFATPEATASAGHPANWLTWDDDVEFAPLYRRLLEQCCILVLTEISENNTEEDWVDETT